MSAIRTDTYPNKPLFKINKLIVWLDSEGKCANCRKECFYWLDIYNVCLEQNISFETYLACRNNPNYGNVMHVDGNKSNHDLSNLKFVCHDCHKKLQPGEFN